MGWSNKEMDKAFGHLEEHQYKHYNKALGCKVEGKEHFKQLLNKGGYVSYEKGQELAATHNKNKVKSYDGLSREAKAFIGEVRQMADRKGNIKMSDRFVEGLKKHGVNVDAAMKARDLSSKQGGFR